MKDKIKTIFSVLEITIEHSDVEDYFERIDFIMIRKFRDGYIVNVKGENLNESIIKDDFN